jgi:hypothetical protein
MPCWARASSFARKARPMYARLVAEQIWVIDVQKMVLHVQRAADAADVPLAIALTPSANISLHALPDVQIDLAPLVAE